MLLLSFSAFLLVWVNLKRRKIQAGYLKLLAKNELLTNSLFTKKKIIEELKTVVKQSVKGVKIEVIEAILVQSGLDDVDHHFEIPDSVIKVYNLTATEARVLTQLAYGFRNSDIAQSLKISKSYVHNLRSKLRQKLPLEPNQELEDFAVALRKDYEPTTPQASSRTSA